MTRKISIMTNAWRCPKCNILDTLHFRTGNRFNTHGLFNLDNNHLLESHWVTVGGELWKIGYWRELKTGIRIRERWNMTCRSCGFEWDAV